MDLCRRILVEGANATTLDVRALATKSQPWMLLLGTAFHRSQQDEQRKGQSSTICCSRLPEEKQGKAPAAQRVVDMHSLDHTESAEPVVAFQA